MVSSRRPHNSFVFLLLSFTFLFSFITSTQASLLSLDLSTTSDDQYTCSSDKPCSNGACCSESGNCGYDPAHCGAGCVSNCNATAACGKYAEVPNQGCPLNVCCSEFGFCGTTSEFCGKGCQSHCTQPKPSVQESDVQKRIIGYWEAWNMDDSCGTMEPGEIPVQLLSHLIISFGYISHEYKITNMDGVSPDLYKIVGDLKQRNPKLKIMIALGGWTFNDPGTWQSVFPTMVSTQANRKTFINNLLGFLSEYGYDGVDFDWEYPGADDRGGSNADGANYAQLLKELKAAIAASGRDYLVTFTSPTSYWYLRHFDLKKMTENVDWVNLMAYDLHGVWDGDNPIGSQVLAHTNLTGIDEALDLFWRVDVDPSSIVLGLGFYGRTYKLDDASCWKPGCGFSSAGSKGPCTATEGILSYREISQIRKDIGGTAYLDKEAAVRYMVYDDDSWVSFDDETTFQMKIDYANKMGLSGLMIWAIDLDDNRLSALRAVSNSDTLGNSGSEFDLVNLAHIFPEDIRPPNTTKPVYGISTFGGADSMSPNGGGFGFLLLAGESHAVSRLRRRDNEPEPFHFLDCPSNLTDAPKDHVHTARVVCLSDDLNGCFQVMERGVEGTIVEMPDNCAPNTFARAVSLELSENQAVSAKIKKRNPTSQVYNFKFDYDMGLSRRDTTNKTSIRLDYSNVKGYWDRIVDSPGIDDDGEKEARSLVKRFYSNSNKDWKKDYGTSNAFFEYESTNAIPIKQNISELVWYQTASDCEVDGEEYGEAFAAYVTGEMDAKMYIGFSMVAEYYGGELDVQQANGFVKAGGKSDLIYGIDGYSEVDFSRADKGNPIEGAKRSFNLKGTTISAGQNSFVSFNPYLEVTYELASLNGSDSTNFNNGATSFIGHLSTRVTQDFSNVTAFWPIDYPEDRKPDSGSFAPNDISVSKNNKVFYSDGDGGKLAVGTSVKFGVNVELEVHGRSRRTLESTAVGDMALMYNTFSEFSFYPGVAGSDESCSDFTISTVVFQKANSKALEAAGWSEHSTELGADTQEPGSGICYSNYVSQSSTKRSLDSNVVNNSTTASEEIQEEALIRRADPGYVAFPGDWTYGPAQRPPSPNELLEDGVSDLIGDATEGALGCRNCGSCTDTKDKSGKKPCCGCVSMDYKWSFDDIPSTPYCLCCSSSPNNGKWPTGSKRIRLGSAKRGFNSSEDETFEEQDDAVDDEDDEGETTLHELEGRARPTIRTGSKTVTMCALSDYAPAPGNYPQFPDEPTKPWEGVQRGIWDPISRYWGNTSGLCTDWSVGALTYHDNDTTPQGKLRSNYQTEHVFEGQLIGDFFSDWLNNGAIFNQLPKPRKPKAKWSCDKAKDYVFADPDGHWTYYQSKKMPNAPTTFFKLILAELGSKGHLDRLTIFKSRANGMKGAMFGGKQAVSINAWAQQPADDQLQNVKTMGMVFEYMNDPKVWEMFCAVYEAIYKRLGEFDDFHASLNRGFPKLQDEWPKFIDAVLTSTANRSKGTLQWMWRKRAEKDNTFYNLIWGVNILKNVRKITLPGTCPNLPRS